MDEIDELIEDGFVGFVTFRDLRAGAIDDIPDHQGVYVICIPADYNVEFLNDSIGGWFKGKNPSVDLNVLSSNWISGTRIIYVGRAGGLRKGGRVSRATLRKRLKQYSKFGVGIKIGHWGGRFIWQLKNSDSFLVAYRPLVEDNPVDVETRMLENFSRKYGKLPFANLSTGEST